MIQYCFFFQAEDGIRDKLVTGVQTCALPISNTQEIVNGNANDNSVNGIEHDGDYAFKTVLDLEYNNFDDWFIPSRDSMQAIYDNVHVLGMGDFNEELTYWTSTKVGYSPYVMNFSIDWGGIALPGLCTNSNGIMIVRKL